MTIRVVQIVVGERKKQFQAISSQSIGAGIAARNIAGNVEGITARSAVLRSIRRLGRYTQDRMFSLFTKCN